MKSETNKPAPEGASNKSHTQPITESETNQANTVESELNPIIKPSLEDRAKELKAYYDHNKKEYLLHTNEGYWRGFNQAQSSRKLKMKGFSHMRGDTGLSEVDKVIDHIEENNSVDYANPIAGKMAGVYKENGNTLLATKSPEIIESKEGDFNTLKQVIENLLSISEKEHIGKNQYYSFIYWLKIAVDSLRSGTKSFGQVIAIAGEANCGKSLLQQIITLALGGRSAKAGAYFQGKSKFNSDLCQAEHLVIEDDHCSTVMKDRLAFGAELKKASVSARTVNCEMKGRPSVHLSVWWRVSISLNSNPEALNILPPLNEDIADKIMLFKASKYEMPMPTETSELQEKFMNKLIEEMPAFIHYLMHLKIPDEYKCNRFGVKTYQHPYIKNALFEISPERRLLEMIDSIKDELIEKVYEGTEHEKWEGSATDLRERLVSDLKTQRDAERMIEHSKACGNYLQRLVRTCPERIKSTKVNGKSRYTLFFN